MNPKSANLLEMMSPEDREKMASRERLRSNLITREWAALAEFGFYYGWSAVRDVFNDVITIKQMNMFLEGARKVHSSHVYDQAVAGLAANSTKKGQFQKVMKPFIKDMKAVQ